MERRRAPRVAVSIPTKVDVLPEARGPSPSAQPEQGDIERVRINTEMAGEFFQAQLLDLSENGARLSAETAPPLLARVGISFRLDGVMVPTLGLVMWRTRAPGPDGRLSFGVLFEAVPIEVRQTILRLVDAHLKR